MRVLRRSRGFCRRDLPASARRRRYPPHVMAPELSALQVKLFTSRTASIVSDPRPKSAFAIDTPPLVVVNTLVLSVLTCACTTKLCVPTPTLGSRKLKLCAELVSRTRVISSGVKVHVVGLAAHSPVKMNPRFADSDWIRWSKTTPLFRSGSVLWSGLV